MSVYATQITVTSGNLFKIAAEQYGDATCWFLIASANNLIDPFFSFPTPTVLQIPPANNSYIGGVPQ